MMSIKPLSFSFAVLFLITNLFLTYTAVSVEQTNQINQLEGFEGLKWGTEIKSFQNMEFVKSGRTSQGEIKIDKNLQKYYRYSEL
jgi:hypothetical protein